MPYIVIIILFPICIQLMFIVVVVVVVDDDDEEYES